LFPFSSAFPWHLQYGWIFVSGKVMLAPCIIYKQFSCNKNELLLLHVNSDLVNLVSLPGQELKQIIDDSAAELHHNSSDFWVMVAALKVVIPSLVCNIYSYSFNFDMVLLVLYTNQFGLEVLVDGLWSLLE